MHPEQKRAYQSMTLQQKLQIAVDLYYAARNLKTAGLRYQHPEWSDKEIQEKVREIFLHGKS